MNVIVCLEPSQPGRSAAAALAMAAALPSSCQLTVLSASSQPIPDQSLLTREPRVSRQILLCDRRLETTDYLGFGSALGHAARKLNADLILTGTQSDEESQAALGAAIANALAFTFVARVETLALDTPATGAATASVKTELRAGGRVRRLRIPLPAVLTVVPVESPPRRRTRTNQSPVAIERWSLAEAGCPPDRLSARDELGLFVPLTTKVTAATSARQFAQACGFPIDG